MKTKLILACFLVTLLAFSGCKKDTSTPDPVSPTYPIEGLWIGTFTVDNNPSQPGSYYYSYAIYPDGSVLVKSRPADGNNYYSTGTWTLSATNKFSATITTMNFSGPQVTQTITADFVNTGEMTGVWNDTINASQTGKLSMKRIN